MAALPEKSGECLGANDPGARVDYIVPDIGDVVEFLARFSAE
jgi:hypothetical protein